jgi:hypothetical protein
MDPVTGVQLAASAAQILDLSYKVFVNFHTYYRAVRDSPARSADLRVELDSLVDLPPRGFRTQSERSFLINSSRNYVRSPKASW